ncbi:coiled-coil domain-containing protein 57 isoform X2 [Ascaphus truei]
MLPQEEDFPELLSRKEQEWKALQHRQVQFLETTLQENKKRHQEQTEQFSRLKEDFTHNLKVLGERDRELEQYEMMFSHLKVVENAKQSEISDLKIHIEKLQQEVEGERKRRDELQCLYQRKVREHQIEVEREHSSKSRDIDHHREEYKKVKRQLERKIEEVEGDLTLQKQELTLEFDAEMKKREHEFGVNLDAMSTLVLSHELKVKLLSKELDVLRENSLNASESLQKAESTNQRFQEELKRKEWEIKDLSAVKDARVKEAEDRLHSLQLKCRREEETFQRKHEQMDRFAREKESALRTEKAAHAEQVQLLENQVREMQLCIETLRTEQHRVQCSHQEALAEKETAITTLREDLDTLKSGWDSHIAQMSKETVNKDLEIQSLQEEDTKLKARLSTNQKHIERYQQQLSQAVEREHVLEQAKVQAELDWQKRCEHAEQKQYKHSEELIESLNKAKEEAVAELKEKDRKLRELETLVSTVGWKRHGVTPGIGAQIIAEENQDFHNVSHSSEIHKLQEQNAELRTVIGQMREEMESLCATETQDNVATRGPLRADQVPSVAANRQLEARAAHLHFMVTELTHKVHQKQAQMEQLQLANESRPSQAALAGLHQRRAELELPPAEARKEAGEYLKGNLQQRLQVVGLGNESTSVNQLQEEILNLRQKLAWFRATGGASPEAHVQLLHNKLKVAAKKISQLSIEKQQLIEMGNRLRAEPALADANLPQTPLQSVFPTLSSKPHVSGAQNGLSALEDLQYQLTSQELQYAQYQHSTRLSAKDRTNFIAKHQRDNGDTPGFSKMQMLIIPSLVDDQIPEQNEKSSHPSLEVHKMNSVQTPHPEGSWSGGDGSLQDVWKILDMGSSPSLVSSRDDHERVIIARSGPGQRNKSTEASSKNRASPPLLKYQKEKANKPLAVYQSKTKGSQNAPKIRNYNIRD